MDHLSRARVLGLGGQLPPLHLGLRHHHSSSDTATSQGWLPLGCWRRGRLHASAGAHNGLALQLPDFDRDFVVKCDASGSGFGAVLHQGAQSLTFFSKPIAARRSKLVAYKRELIGLVQAVHHWRAYLWGRTFVIHSDHYSLKYLLVLPSLSQCKV
jgi:hypothetical protein